MRANAKPVEGGNEPKVRTDRSEVLDKALGKLGRAITKNHIQPICTAYQKFLASTAHMSLDVDEVFALVDEALGLAARPRDTVIFAFSHRHCFMCTDGTLSCEHCNETGRDLGGETCPACEGLGFVGCGFCNGTGWADRNLIPRELRGAAIRERTRHVLHAMIRLNRKKANFTVEAVRELTPQAYRKLLSWVMRCLARLEELAESDALQGEEQKLELLTQADNAAGYVEMLRQR